MTVNFSEATRQDVRQRLKQLPGEWERVHREAGVPLPPEPAGPASPSEVEALLQRVPMLDWHEVLDPNRPPAEWLCEPFLEAGKQAALFAEAKAGKSLLALEIACGVATGRAVLGNPARPPRHVLYIDHENSQDDLADRLRKLGYGADELARLHYASFPPTAALNTPAGGKEVAALASAYDADLVIIDTLSRVIEGSENDSEPYHAFYRYTGQLLKAAGIAMLRLDHSGKDGSRGMRGSSAKTSDVDSVWELKADGDVLTLRRTHARNARGADHVQLVRFDDPLRHETQGHTDAVTQAEARLDLIEFPESGSLRGAESALREAGYTVKNQHAREGQKRRQKRAPDQGHTPSPESADKGVPPEPGHGGAHPTPEGENSPESQGKQACPTDGAHPRAQGAGETPDAPCPLTPTPSFGVGGTGADSEQKTASDEGVRVPSYEPVDMSFIHDLMGGEQ